MRQGFPDDIDREKAKHAIVGEIEGHPLGLRPTAIRRQIHEHPAYDIELPMHAMHPLLGELCRDGTVLGDPWNHVYYLSTSATRPLGSESRYSTSR